MDALTPDEVETPYDPLDVVEHVLTAENLLFAGHPGAEVAPRGGL